MQLVRVGLKAGRGLGILNVRPLSGSFLGSLGGSLLHFRGGLRLSGLSGLLRRRRSVGSALCRASRLAFTRLGCGRPAGARRASGGVFATSFSLQLLLDAPPRVRGRLGRLEKAHIHHSGRVDLHWGVSMSL